MTGTAAEATGGPPKKKKTWQATTWIALASAATAIVAAVISLNQVNVAGQQNTVAEQTQLVTLTTTITSQLAQAQPSSTSSNAPSNTPSNTPSSTPSSTSSNRPSSAPSGAPSSTAPSAQSAATLAQVTGEANAEQGQFAQLSADGEAAAVLINNLHGDGVAGIEYIQVARALQAGGEEAQAVTYYKDAIAVSRGDVVTSGTALRGLAGLYYSLGWNGLARQNMMKAARIFSGHLVLSHQFIEESIAEAYLADAYFQISLHACSVATTDLTAAVHAFRVAKLKAISDPILFTLADEDVATARAKCVS